MFEQNKHGLRTWLEIDRDNLQYNYNIFRSLIPSSCLLAAVTKSNAYGHSLVDYSREVSRLGVDCLMVDSIIEGIKLRMEGLTKPILVLGYTLPSMIEEANASRISISISNFESLYALLDLNVDGLKIHLKFDTGMCRQGFFPEDTARVLDFLEQELPQVKIEGVFTHFAGAKNPAFPQGTKQQLAKFEIVLAEFARRGLKPIRHAAATSGAIVFPQSHFDMVRIGIGLYGLWPSTEVKYAYSDKFNLKPILTWKTVISEIKTVPAGSRVGYDFTEELERESKIGILPVGYWHGYDRGLSSLGRVIINGRRARVLGRVSMDMLIVDLTDLPIAVVGDEVTLIGRANLPAEEAGGAEMSADEMASVADTSSYEIITRLNPLIKRFYI